MSYTAQFGSGLSAAVAVEDGRFHAVLSNQDLGPDLAAITPADINARGGSERPDFVGTLRLEQIWGLAQLSIAAHQSRVAYTAAHYNGAGNIWGWAIIGGCWISTCRNSRQATSSLQRLPVAKAH